MGVQVNVADDVEAEAPETNVLLFLPAEESHFFNSKRHKNMSPYADVPVAERGLGRDLRVGARVAETPVKRS